MKGRNLLLGGLTGLLLANPTLADSARLVTAQAVHQAADMSSAVLGKAERAQSVEVLQRSGGWARIRAGTLTGWVRMLALAKQTGAEGGNPAGANGGNPLVMVTGIREVAIPKASAHALIVTNNNYRNGITKLPGTEHDRGSALLIARALGVPEANTHQASDVDLETLRAELDRLETAVKPNDEVFLYFSGHGARMLAEDGRADRCAEALVTVDGQALFDNELAERLDKIAAKAKRIVALIDACHSGGATTRAVGTAAASHLTGKVWTKSGGETCTKSTNVLTRSLGDKSPGSGRQNYVYIAAAQSDEVALDDSAHGGLATQAWLECIGGAARDLDGSSGLSVSELQACAQPLIAGMVKSANFLPHHISVTGNADMRLVGKEPEPGVEPSALATLRDLHAGRDDRRVVHLVPDQPSYRIGQDRVRMSLSSSHNGYVYLLMIGSDGKSFDLLYPNKRDRENWIRAGQVLNLPRSGWAIRPGGPVGKDHILAIVSDAPRDYSGIGMQATGPFSSLATSASATRDIQLVTAASPSCETGVAKRALQIVEDECSDAYGADLISLEEIQ